jgi:hypothetical protein
VLAAGDGVAPILPGGDGDGAIHGPHIIDDGVAEAEASDHLDEEGEEL